MRLYLETKVVKVKKSKNDNIAKLKETLNGIRNMMKIKPFMIYMPDILLALEKEYENKLSKSKGNWVNGENLDKIKFPVPCSYGKDKRKGLMSMNNGYYYVMDITEQKKVQRDVSEKCNNLKEFIEFNDIHILKGKIILFEEE